MQPTTVVKPDYPREVQESSNIPITHFQHKGWDFMAIADEQMTPYQLMTQSKEYLNSLVKAELAIK